tara:strand:- start:817 stop:1176 length:360 start_codon:yes stop_codon:yes gene_type:complete
MDKQYKQRLQAVWEAVCGSSGGGESWFHEISILEWPRYPYWEGAWDDQGVLRVSIDDPIDVGNYITKDLTAHDLNRAYEELIRKDENLHCGDCDVVDDPDSCSTDKILQQAVLGEYTYA